LGRYRFSNASHKVLTENVQKATDATVKAVHVYNVPIQFFHTFQKSTLKKGRNSFKGKV
jgi:hypothetical protein